MNKQNKKPRRDDMYEAILTLETVEECKRFFDDLCTVTELQAMEQRYQVAVYLSQGMIYNDILERTGVAGADAHPTTSVIFHWFSGSSEEFARARRLGCYFSVSEHMLKSKRGREYARQLPEGRLLLETDAPPGLDAPYSAEALEASLTRALATIAEIRRVPQDALGHTIATTSAALLHLG